MKRQLASDSLLPPRGALYLRDSGGKHEMTPGQYVAWAARRAKDLQVSFGGTGDEIERMIRDGIAVSGDLFLDYGVKGNLLTRPALNELLRQVTVERSISHVFIPRRDRLARPENPVDGMMLEIGILDAGASLVLMGGVIDPPKDGQHDIGKLINMLIDYHRSGKDRRDLAEKMILAQVSLAQMGFSTGGRSPYGFERWLVDGCGKRIRPLNPGEVVRMQGHHVVWLPKENSLELATAMRIRRDLLHKPASQIKRELTAEGIPSPDAGRTRKDNGVTHTVSGEWHVNTITAIGRHSLYQALSRYGERSMGDQLRFSPSGPRPLTASDRSTGKSVKVIRNDPNEVIKAKAHFIPLATAAEDAELQRILDQRAGTQRGKPRSQDPTRNPLGCKVFDMKCGWPMYREPYLGSFRHVCGAYRHRKCDYNHVDGPTAVRLATSIIQQKLLSPKATSAFQATIEMLQNGGPQPETDSDIEAKNTEFARVKEDLATVEGNLARAKSESQFNAISREFDKLSMRASELHAEIKGLGEQRIRPAINQNMIADVGRLLEEINVMAAKSDDYSSARAVFDALKLRLFFNFRKVEDAKQRQSEITGGIATFGDAPSPVVLYNGPTGRRGKPDPSKKDDHPRPPVFGKASVFGDQVGKEDTLANVSRGDRTSIELFSGSCREWTTSLVAVAQALTT